jgi:molybdopterin-guanine dinucleotide biosynthesis protein A
VIPISAVILAGGRSKRLGVNKAFVQIGGQALIERVISRLRELSDDLIIVANEPGLFQGLGARVTGDVFPGKASLGGIYSGLLVARHDYALVVGCDMPFLSRGLLRYMILVAPGYDAIVPFYDNYLEPLHTIYHKTSLEVMREMLEADRLRISELFGRQHIRQVTVEEIASFDPQRLSFFNINTPQDLQRAQELSAQEAN